MKFLENEKFTELTAELSDAFLGHRKMDGRLEAYTMKRGANDKKFAYSLGKKYIQDLEEQQEILASFPKRKRSNSVDVLSLQEEEEAPPRKKRSQSVDYGKLPHGGIGDFAELATRRLMTDLILTLNASFPDYDFSSVKPNQFVGMSLETARTGIYERLSEFSSQKKEDWLVELWMSVNDVIDLRDAHVYQFVPGEDMFDESTLWSFSYFFVNKSLRRLVFFTCSETICESDNESEDEEERISFYPVDSTVVNEESMDMDVLTTGGMSIPVPLTTT